MLACAYCVDNDMQTLFIVYYCRLGWFQSCFFLLKLCAIKSNQALHYRNCWTFLTNGLLKFGKPLVLPSMPFPLPLGSLCQFLKGSETILNQNTINDQLFISETIILDLQVMLINFLVWSGLPVKARKTRLKTLNISNLSVTNLSRYFPQPFCLEIKWDTVSRSPSHPCWCMLMLDFCFHKLCRHKKLNIQNTDQEHAVLQLFYTVLLPVVRAVIKIVIHL